MVSLSQSYRATACIYVMILGIFAMVDAMNGYTYPLYAWRSMVFVEVAAMILGLIMAMRGLLSHADKQNYVKVKAEERALLKEKTSQAQLTLDYIASVSKHGTNFVFFGVLTVTSLWALIAVMFCYEYTRNQPGYQSELDRGFPTDSAFYFAVNAKWQFLFIMQLQMVQALAICIAGTAACYVRKYIA